MVTDRYGRAVARTALERGRWRAEAVAEPLAAEEAVAVVITAMVIRRSEPELTELRHGLRSCALHDGLLTDHCAIFAELLRSSLPPPRMSLIPSGPQTLWTLD